MINLKQDKPETEGRINSIHFSFSGFSNRIGIEKQEVIYEQKLGVSKLNFYAGNTYFEVKTPLQYFRNNKN